MKYKETNVGTVHFIESCDEDTEENNKKDEFTLIWIDKKSVMPTATKNGMIETFTQVYPQLVKRFNPNSARTVTFEIDAEEKSCPAWTEGDRVTFSCDWFLKCPHDLDVVTHEIMHVVQAYPNGQAPSWVIEGLADYVRNKYGLSNQQAGWSMPSGCHEQHHYTDSYRVAARFFTWLEENYSSGDEKKVLERLDSMFDYF